MKFVRIVALPALLIATPAQAEPLSQYANTCAQKLGLVAIPSYTCQQGVAIPTGAGFYLPTNNNRIGRVQTANPNVDGVFLCRDYNAATDTSGLNGYILQNQVTGDTCFFDAKPGGSAFVVSPNASNASDYWVNPENMVGECQTCHSSDPFIVTPGIVNAMRSQGVVRAGRTTRGAYNIVNSDVSTSHFSNWNNERQITGGCGPTCHLGSATSDSVAMVSMAQNQGWMTTQYTIPPTEQRAAIGVWRPAASAWFYFDKDYSRSWNSGDPSGQFGGTGDQPVVLRGTQCAGGAQTYTRVGVRRGNTWYTTTNNLFYDTPDDWNMFNFGTSGLPASWNGVAVSFQNNGFLIDYNGNGAAGGDVTFSFGGGNDKPLIGRWARGIGHRMAVYRVVNGTGFWYLDTNGNNGWDSADTSAQFGGGTDIPFSGDFDGDGDDEIGVFRNGTWFVDMNNNFAWNGVQGGDAEWFFGGTGDIPIVSPTSWACGW
jgi:hypothetical protein